MKKAKILIVEDDVVISNLLAIKLKKYDLFFAITCFEAQEILKKNEINIIILDVNLQFESGLSLLSKVPKKYYVILLTCVHDLDINELQLKGVHKYLIKSQISLKKCIEEIHSTAEKLNLNTILAK